MAYIKDFVATVNGSTLSVNNVLSDLRCHHHRRGLPWLSPSDQILVKRAIDLLRLVDPTESKQSRGLTREILLKMVSHMNLRDLSDLETATMCFLCHDALLRADEMFGDLAVKNFRWSADRRTVFLILWRTKTHRQGNALEIELVDPGDGCICAVSLLRRWFTAMGLWSQFDMLVFPRISRGGTPERTVPRSRRSWSLSYKRFLAAAGFNPAEYTDHGFRAGGATDLFDTGMILACVMEFGRWKSAESCLRYYRKRSDLGSRVAHAFIASVVPTVDQKGGVCIA